MRRRVPLIRDEYVKARVIIRENSFCPRTFQIHPRDSVFFGWNEYIQRGQARLKWQRQEFVFPAQIVDSRQITRWFRIRLFRENFSLRRDSRSKQGRAKRERNDIEGSSQRPGD